MSFVFDGMSFSSAEPVGAGDFTLLSKHEETCGCAACAGPAEAAGDGLGGYAGTKPVWSLTQVIDNFVNRPGKVAGMWPVGQTIVYSFRDALPAGYASGVEFVALTAIERQMARLAFDLIADLINVTFVEAPDDGLTPATSNRIYFGADSALPDYEWGHASNWSYATTPRKTLAGSEIWLNADNVANRAWFAGGYNFQGLTHEILHALGIPHPGDYNANGQAITYAANAAYAQDSRQFTIMSYFSAENTGALHSTLEPNGASSGWSGSTPLLHDVAALQALYGANLNTRSGDTVYGYNSTAGRSVFDFANYGAPVSTPQGAIITPDPIVTIWDGGGIDTLDLSGTTLAVNVDLRPGAFSDAFGMTNNISIAHGALIENAIGGAASDRIVGNDAGNLLLGLSGADWLEGGAGDDGLYGGEGADIHLGGDGADRIAGGAGDDYLNGGAGIDDLHGEPGADTLYGEGDIDFLYGWDGDDGLYGGAGDDFHSGGEGNDRLAGSIGNDQLYGGAHEDQLFGEEGDDRISGDDGYDVLYGGDGHDALVGGAHGDVLYGEAGFDWIEGGSGSDLMSGGASGDRFKFYDVSDSRPGAERDFILDFNGFEDVIDLASIDADLNAAGDQGFFWANGFTGQAGQAVLSYDAPSNVTTFMADVNGDGQADFVLQMTGQHGAALGWLL